MRPPFFRTLRMPCLTLALALGAAAVELSAQTPSATPPAAPASNTPSSTVPSPGTAPQTTAPASTVPSSPSTPSATPQPTADKKEKKKKKEKKAEAPPSAAPGSVGTPTSLCAVTLRLQMFGSGDVSGARYSVRPASGGSTVAQGDAGMSGEMRIDLPPGDYVVTVELGPSSVQRNLQVDSSPTKLVLVDVPAGFGGQGSGPPR